MKYILIIVFACSLCHGADPIYIPIGSNCVATGGIKHRNLRLAAYPFDWLISPFNSLYATIEEDFARFFTDLKLTFDCGGAQDVNGLTFIHDWRVPGHENADVGQVDWVPNNRLLRGWELDVPKIKEKYDRRISRFRSALESGSKIVFVRYNEMTRLQAISFRNLIQKRYPELQFILVVVSPKKHYSRPWKQDKIRNYCLVHNDSIGWSKMLNEVALAFEE